jgi:hypothetical protein
MPSDGKTQYFMGKPVRNASRMSLDIDEESDVPVSVQLREALRQNSSRVIDLFRDWDGDESGTVSLKEFRRAMKELGLDAPLDVVDGVFASFDPDGSGSLEYTELKKLLSKGGGAPHRSIPHARVARPPLHRATQRST